MNTETLAEELHDIRKFFERSTSVLEESDSDFAPVEGMFTVAQQVYHVAHTLDWAIEGFFGKGWDMDFEAHNTETTSITSLTEARAAFARAFENAEVVIRSCTQDQLDQLSPSDSPIMPNKPRYDVIGVITDHTAHHRGALTVYSRLLKKTPPMPYM